MIMPPYFHPEILMHYPIEEIPLYLKKRILDYANLVIRKCAYNHQDKNAELMVCKAIEPFLFDVKILHELFPEAQFVTLTRDPAKQITSRYSFYQAQQLTSHKYQMDPKVWGMLISKRTQFAVEFIMQYFYRENNKYSNVKFEDFCIDQAEFDAMFTEYVTYC